MRVVAGRARGTRLHGPGKLPVRPTSDRVREALFSVLGDQAARGNVLDVFAGCGTLGIEALSRGAERAVFIERDARCRDLIRRNLERTRLADRAAILGGDAFRSVRRLRTLGLVYALLFFDPPYAALSSPRGWARLTAFLTDLMEAGLAERGARMVVEHRAGDVEEALPPALRLLDRRRYGDTGVTLLECVSGP